LSFGKGTQVPNVPHSGKNSGPKEASGTGNPKDRPGKTKGGRADHSRKVSVQAKTEKTGDRRLERGS